MPHKGKGIYSRYESADLEKAVAAVQAGLSLRKAADKYKVPRSTISDRITGKIALDATKGRDSIIPKEIEAQIASKAMDAADRGMGLSRLELMKKAGGVCKALKLKTPFRKGVPGQAWWEGFKSRNPELVLRKPEKLSTVRSTMLNPVSVGRYMVDLKKIIEDNNLKAEHIWNCDETGMSLEHQPVKVCARRGTKSLPGRTGNSRENITVLPCINAAGGSMPPMFIVKGKTRRSLQSFVTTEGPPDAVWTYQQKAWMEDALSHQWFEKVFLENCGVDRPQLLILDSHHSHETLDFLKRADENNILVFALPPHTTHYLCPLDRTVFGPLQKQYNTQCSNFMSEAACNTVNKQSFAKLFKAAYDRAFTRTNIVAGFEACGIDRFNPLAIPKEAFMPSSLTDDPSVVVPEAVWMRDDDQHPLDWVNRACEPGPIPASASEVTPIPSLLTPATSQTSTMPQTATEPPIAIVSQIETMPQPATESPILAFPQIETVPQPAGELPILAVPQIETVPQPATETPILAVPQIATEAQGTTDPLLASLALPAADLQLVEVSVDQSEIDSSVATLLNLHFMGPSTVSSSSEDTFAQAHTKEEHLNFLEPTNLWNSALQNLFSVPEPEIRTPKSKKQKLTSHRLLTSQEILAAKQQELEKKSEQAALKAQRKLQREIRKEKKAKK